MLAVKTHESSVQWRGGRKIDTSKPEFDKVIFLIRNPFKANIAEWNRQISKKYASDQTGSSHVKYVSNEAFFGEEITGNRRDILIGLFCVQGGRLAGRH